MPSHELLRQEFDAADGSFLNLVRSELKWDWTAFRRLTNAMYDAAEEAGSRSTVETWIGQGFWFCDTWIKDWTSHPNFPRPPEEKYREAIELIHDLAYFLFMGESPYEDDSLRVKAKAQKE